MSNDEKRLVECLHWKEQARRDCVEWAKVNVKDPARLKDFDAGVAAGWDQCLNTLKLHGYVNW